jgi:Recombination directionality factor-like
MSIMSQRAEVARVNSPQYAIPIIGVVRPGTKLLVNNAKNDPTAASIAAKAFSGQISFIEAEKLITKQCSGIKKAFYPKNTTHYNVHPSDFAGGAMAVKKLLDLYGEKRDGDNEAKLYSFPVVFPDVGSADAALPVRFESHVGMKYHSQDAEDGTRNCVYIKPVPKEEVLANHAKRIKQVQRRGLTIRGACDPEKCAEFAKGDCKLKGNLQFYIPGLHGLGVVKMPTGSSYALEKIWSQINSLHETVGRIPNFDNNGQPVFTLSKHLEDRQYFDENTGEQRKGPQWVPVLDSRIDSSAILLIQEQRRALLAAPQTGEVNVPTMTIGPAAWRAPLGVAVIEPAVKDVQLPEIQKQDTAMRNFVADEVKQQPKTVDSQPIDALTEIFEVAADFSDELEQYACAKYGMAWDSDETAPLVLSEIKTMLEKLPPDCVPPLLLTFSLAYANKISVEDVCRPYLVQEFGAKFLRNVNLCNAAHEKMKSLLEIGPEVASSFMKNALSKAA